jgi:hypothetical protein
LQLRACNSIKQCFPCRARQPYVGHHRACTLRKEAHDDIGCGTFSWLMSSVGLDDLSTVHCCQHPEAAAYAVQHNNDYTGDCTELGCR